MNDGPHILLHCILWTIWGFNYCPYRKKQFGHLRTHAVISYSIFLLCWDLYYYYSNELSADDKAIYIYI